MTSKALDDTSTAEMWIRGSDGAAGPGHFNSVATSKLNSKGWKETKIGMVIDKKVSQLQIGFGLRGTGKVWIREIKFQALPASTKQELEKKRRIDQEIPLGPVTTTLTNLQFIE
ncbi:hypothetical protein [Undibacterium sp. Xuan67W]|uniref:hypothetical protein n=1 Tax=Undibacterium sp. Xuan67W TaxID=3413057 RepID=UPI003BF169C1